MKKIVYLAFFVLCILINRNIYAQPTFQWVTKFNTNNIIEKIANIKVDHVGNSYILATYKGSMVFPNGIISFSDPSAFGILIAKYDTSGKAIWGYSIDTVNIVSWANNFDMTMDSIGNIYTCIGGTKGNSINLHPLKLCKFNSNGTNIWKTILGPGPSNMGVGSVSSHIILNTQQTELILAGTFNGGYDLDIGNNVILTIGSSYTNMQMIAHYNISNGNAKKGKNLGHNGTNCSGITSMSNGSNYIAFGYNVIKLNSDDSILWSNPVSGGGITGIGTDNTYIYITGNMTSNIIQYQSAIATTNYVIDYYICKISQTGNPVFLKAGSSGTSGMETANGIFLDKKKAFYIYGESIDPVGDPSYTIYSPNEHFILRYDTIGTVTSGSQFNTNLTSAYNTPIVFCINNKFDIFGAGIYKPNGHFGIYSLTNNFSTQDGFIFKIKQCNLSIPTIDNNSGNSICQGKSVTLTSSSAQFYLWSTDETSKTIIVNKSGLYFVKIFDNMGCSATSLPYNLKVNPLPPKPIISRIGYNIVSSSKTGNQWYRDSLLIPGGINQSYSVKQSGCYSVLVTDSNFCSSPMSDTTCYEFTGVNEILKCNSILIFPNPSLGLVNIKSPNIIDEIIITDLYGKIVINYNPSELNFDFQISRKGIYFLNIKSGNLISTTKLSIIK